MYKFLSTPSARRATLDQFLDGIHISISIHALREEGDDTTYMTGKEAVEFLSTPSARRATAYTVAAFPAIFISIHALREEGDGCADFHSLCVVISIHALREEGDGHSVPDGKSSGAISIHALREEGDQWPEFSRNPF